MEGSPRSAKRRPGTTPGDPGLASQRVVRCVPGCFAKYHRSDIEYRISDIANHPNGTFKDRDDDSAYPSPVFRQRSPTLAKILPQPLGFFRRFTASCHSGSLCVACLPPSGCASSPCVAWAIFASPGVTISDAPGGALPFLRNSSTG
jgi:hypothetical protein